MIIPVRDRFQFQYISFLEYARIKVIPASFSHGSQRHVYQIVLRENRICEVVFDKVVKFCDICGIKGIVVDSGNGDITVESILTSRVDMDALAVDTPAEKVVEFLLSHRHSRYPVYEGTTDHIIGTLQMRKYLKAYRRDKHPDLRSLVDAPFFVHYSTPVDDLLREMNAKKVSIAIVLDDFGGTCGVVTLEDIMEELVGDIQDESDAGEGLQLM